MVLTNVIYHSMGIIWSARSENSSRAFLYRSFATFRFQPYLEFIEQNRTVLITVQLRLRHNKRNNGDNNIPGKTSSAQMGVRVYSVLTRNDCIKCYISLLKKIILQQFDSFQTEIQGSSRNCVHLKRQGVTPQ